MFALISKAKAVQRYMHLIWYRGLLQTLKPNTRFELGSMV